MFVVVITKLDEGGIITKFIRSHISPKDLDNTSKAEAVIEPFNLEQILGAFMFWILGLTMSSLIFLMEQVYMKCKSFGNK